MKLRRTNLASALRWSERYTKTDMSYLLRGGSWLTFGQAAGTLSSFILAVLFANLLPKETYGTYKFVLSIVGVLSVATLPGISMAILRKTAQGEKGLQWPGLKVKILWGLAGGVTSLGLSLYYLINENTLLAASFLLAAVFIPFMDSFSIYQSILNGRREFKRSAVCTVLGHAVSLITLVTTLVLTKNLLVILAVYFSSWTLVQITLYASLRTKEEPQKRSLGKKTLTYGKHLSVMRVLQAAANHIDKVLLFHFLGAVEVAVYTLALSVPNSIGAFISNLRFLAIPKFANRTLASIRTDVGRKLVVFAAAAVLVIALYILVSPLIYKLFFPQYPESVLISQILSFSLLGVLGVIPVSAFKSHAAVKELYLYNTVSPLVQILLLVILIPLGGIMGAALARVFGRLFDFLFSYALLRWYTPKQLVDNA